MAQWEGAVMGMRVIDLRPGDVVTEGNSKATIIMIAERHPIYPSMCLVIWRLDNGTVSFDALSPLQELGELVPVTADERNSNLLEALGIQQGRRT